MDEERLIHEMRQLLPHDLSSGCTDQDLLDAAEKPAYPLFLSNIPKAGVFRLDTSDADAGMVELLGQGQRVLLPTERTTTSKKKNRFAIPCASATSNT